MKRDGRGGLSILVAAENSFIHHYFSSLFAGKHFLTAALSGRQAISELTKRPYDLVLINEYLPDMGPADLLAAAGRCRPDAKSVVMLTHGEDADRLIARHGAAGAVIKPFAVADILQVAARVLPAGSARDLLYEYALTRFSVTPLSGR